MILDTKRCARCGAGLPCTNEYFYRDPKYSDGLKPNCKSCISALQSTYRPRPCLLCDEPIARPRDGASRRMCFACEATYPNVYAARVAAFERHGWCACCGAHEVPLQVTRSGKRICDGCQARRIKARQARRLRLRSGLCKSCGVQPRARRKVGNGLIQDCEACRQKLETFRGQRIRNGLCRDCGGPAILRADGTRATICSSCIEVRDQRPDAKGIAMAVIYRRGGHSRQRLYSLSGAS